MDLATALNPVLNQAAVESIASRPPTLPSTTTSQHGDDASSQVSVARASSEPNAGRAARERKQPSSCRRKNSQRAQRQRPAQVALILAICSPAVDSWAPRVAASLAGITRQSKAPHAWLARMQNTAPLSPHAYACPVHAGELGTTSPHEHPAEPASGPRGDEHAHGSAPPAAAARDGAGIRGFHALLRRAWTGDGHDAPEPGRAARDPDDGRAPTRLGAPTGLRARAGVQPRHWTPTGPRDATHPPARPPANASWHGRRRAPRAPVARPRLDSWIHGTPEGPHPRYADRPAAAGPAGATAASAAAAGAAGAGCRRGQRPQAPDPPHQPRKQDPLQAGARPRLPGGDADDAAWALGCLPRS